MGFFGRLGHDLQHPVKALFPPLPDLSKEVRDHPTELAEAIGIVIGAIGLTFAAKTAGEDLGHDAVKEFLETEMEE